MIHKIQIEQVEEFYLVKHDLNIFTKIVAFPLLVESRGKKITFNNRALS